MGSYIMIALTLAAALAAFFYFAADKGSTRQDGAIEQLRSVQKTRELQVERSIADLVDAMTDESHARRRA